jgi:hypothetical protein
MGKSVTGYGLAAISTSGSFAAGLRGWIYGYRLYYRGLSDRRCNDRAGSRGDGTGDLEKVRPRISPRPYGAKGVHPPSRLISSDLATVVAPVNRAAMSAATGRGDLTSWP